jgi:hypothetical protein
MKNASPVGWYVAKYLIRFIELESGVNEDLEQRFLSWENTVIVKANDLDEAYDKVVAVALQATEPYRGEPDGISVQWLFEGVTELLPIYEELEDGSEIMWAEHNPRKLRNLRKLVKNRGDFAQ